MYKGDSHIETFHVHRQSHYLFGRDQKIADIRLDHLSASKQHAVLQFKQKATTAVDGSVETPVYPYIIDLGSTNQTFLNGTAIESQKYYQLLEKDVLKFGHSTREYVLLNADAVIAGEKSVDAGAGGGDD